MRFKLNSTQRVYAYCSTLSLGGFVFGYNWEALTGIVQMRQFYDDVIHGDLSGQIIGVTSLCAAAGCLVAGAFADRLGRKAILACGGCLFLLTSPLLIAAENSTMFRAGRAVSGFATGSFTTIVPLYIAEIAPKNLRGRLMAIEQFALTLGIASSDWITYGTHHLPTSASWSLPIALQLLPCTVLMLSLLVIPESPRYLVAKRQDERALQILATIRGDGTTNHPHVVMEYHAMRQAITYENGFRNHDSYTRLFSGPPENNLRRLLLGVTVQSAMQWTGTPVVIAFAAQILPGLDIQVGSPQLFSNAISGTVYCVSSFFAMVFIDHYSRRFTLFIGALLGFVCLAIMGTIAIIGDFKYVQKAWDLAISGDEIYDDIVPHHDSEFAYRNAVAFLVLGNLFIAIMGYTWGVISWVYPSELYTQSMRAYALSISAASGWLFTFVVLKITPTMLTSIHGATYFVYAISCLITAFIVHLFFPETNGKSLEEVDLIFQSNLNYYDENTHHPQSAAETMAEMDKLREKESLLYPLFDAESASGAKTSIFEYPVLEDLWTYHRRVSPPSPSLQTNVGNIKQ